MENNLTKCELIDAIKTVSKKVDKEFSYLRMIENGLDIYQIVNCIIVDMFIFGIKTSDYETIESEIKIREYIKQMNVEGYYTFKN